VRSHDLNRLLDEPGPYLPPSEIIFSAIARANGLGGAKADGCDDLRPSLQWCAAPDWAFSEAHQPFGADFGRAEATAHPMGTDALV
jgi:hypothetical protein